MSIITPEKKKELDRRMAEALEKDESHTKRLSQ